MPRLKSNKFYKCLFFVEVILGKIVRVDCYFDSMSAQTHRYLQSFSTLINYALPFCLCYYFIKYGDVGSLCLVSSVINKWY